MDSDRIDRIEQMLMAINVAVFHRDQPMIRRIHRVAPELLRMANLDALYGENERYFRRLKSMYSDFEVGLMEDFFPKYEGTREDQETLNFFMQSRSIDMSPYMTFMWAAHLNLNVAVYILERFAIENDDGIEDALSKPLWSFVCNRLSPTRREAFLMPYAYRDLEHYNRVFPLDDIVQKYRMIVRELANRLPKEMVFEVLAAEGFRRKSIEYLWTIQ